MDQTGTTSTTSTTPAATAPVSTGTTASATTTEKRPTTFEAAFAANPVGADAAAPVTADATAPLPATPDPAPTSPQTAEGQTPPPAKAKGGPIPLERHEAVVANTRAKTKDEVLRHVVQEHGESIRLGQALRDNPAQTAVSIVDTLLSDPQHGPAFKAALAERLNGHASPTTATTLPEMDVVDAQGNPLGWSKDAAKALVAVAVQQAKQAVAQDLTPLKSDLEARQEADRAARATAHLRQQAQTGATKRFEALAKLPHFEEARAHMGDLIKGGMTAELAYAQVLATRILPAQTAKAQAALVQSAAAQSAAATTSPGQTRPTVATKVKSFEDQDWSFLNRSA